MKKWMGSVTAVIICSLLAACGRRQAPLTGEENSWSEISSDWRQEELSEEESFEEESSYEELSEEMLSGEESPGEEQHQVICPEGTTLATRFNPPEGFERLQTEEGSFAQYLREYPVKEADSPVLLYDGREKRNQGAHAAVLALPLEAEDLQQCADSVMRIYAEYFFESGQYEKMQFHFTNGFLAEYVRWRDGYRISVKGNQVSWVKSAEYDDSYETFVKYMRMVFAYAGTLSLETEAENIELVDIRPGDIFLMGGSPGHVVMIVDVCEDAEGQKAFLLAQGYMPAQEFHVLINPAHKEDPWYYEEELRYPLQTPEYHFREGSLKRLQYDK